MSDEVEVAESMSDLAKRSGLKNYLWLYFLIVPLAASTASAVAIIIAALQGLSDHELAAQIYAKTLIIGFKAIGSIAVAYLTGLLLSLTSVWLYSLRRVSVEDRQREFKRFIARQPVSERPDEHEFADRVTYEISRHEWRQQVLVVGAVFYSALILAAGFYWLLADDVSQLWRLISDIAAGGAPLDPLAPADSTPPP